MRTQRARRLRRARRTLSATNRISRAQPATECCQRLARPSRCPLGACGGEISAAAHRERRRSATRWARRGARSGHRAARAAHGASAGPARARGTSSAAKDVVRRLAMQLMQVRVRRGHDEHLRRQDIGRRLAMQPCRCGIRRGHDRELLRREHVVGRLRARLTGGPRSLLVILSDGMRQRWGDRGEAGVPADRRRRRGARWPCDNLSQYDLDPPRSARRAVLSFTYSE